MTQIGIHVSAAAAEILRVTAAPTPTLEEPRDVGDALQIQGGRNSGFWKEVEKKKAEGKSEEAAVAEVVQQIKEG